MLMTFPTHLFFFSMTAVQRETSGLLKHGKYVQKQASTNWRVYCVQERGQRTLLVSIKHSILWENSTACHLDRSDFLTLKIQYSMKIQSIRTVSVFTVYSVDLKHFDFLLYLSFGFVCERIIVVLVYWYDKA